MNRKQQSLTQYIDLRERTHEEKMSIINKLLNRQRQREDALDADYFLAGVTFRFERIVDNAGHIDAGAGKQPSDSTKQAKKSHTTR